MSGFQKPIHRDEHIGIDQVPPVTPIEKDKKDTPSFDQQQNNQPKQDEIKTFLVVTLSKFIEKVFEKVPNVQKSNPSFKEHTLKRELLNFRDLLFSLTIHDRSHEIEFLNSLSLVWQNILSSISQIDMNNLLEEAPFIPLTNINDFAGEIMNFPQESDHSLGYYFTENAGKEWIPFPLMKLLQSLHENSQKDSKTSQLQDWISKLDAIILQIY